MLKAKGHADEDWEDTMQRSSAAHPCAIPILFHGSSRLFAWYLPSPYSA